MKALGMLLLMALLTGCLANKIDDLITDADNADTSFVGKVPADFNWSTIVSKQIDVTFMHDGALSKALDNSIIELYNDDNVLIDALTIIDGKASFNVRIPGNSKTLKLVTLATISFKEVGMDDENVVFEVPDINAVNFSRIDTDKDGLCDQFDIDPKNPDLAIKIERQVSQPTKSAARANSSVFSYTIFEDLWPSKGDYDFNDMVIKTTFYWVRGRSNYIQEISGVCSVEWIGAGMGIGLGYELFSSFGTQLGYEDDIVTSVKGDATEDKAVTNGIILFNKVQDVANKQLEFTICLKDKKIKEFAFIPYLFRTENYSQQVRPFGAPPTESQDMTLFGTKNDASPYKWDRKSGDKFKYPLSGSQAFYRTKDNLPWGIEFMAKSFKPSPEKTSITEIYPRFRKWAESGGTENTDWYDYPN